MVRTTKKYREHFGLEPAPSGSFVEIRYMGGAGWYIWWEACPDGEDILAKGFGTKAKAELYAEEQGWNISHS